MNIDLGSLFFNASIETGGGTPSWGTALGQSSPDYKLTYPGAADILIAMDYCYWPLSDSISCKLGKGGKEYKAIASQSEDSKYEITKAAVFYDTYIKVEGKPISINKPFILLVTRENENTHKGRRTLKYSDSVCVGSLSNKDFYDKVQNEIGGPNVCWYAYAIDVSEQNKLILSLVKVSDGVKTYPDAETRKKEWLGLLPADVLVQYQQSEISTQPALNENETEKLFVTWMAKKIKTNGSHYNEQYQNQTKNYLKYQIGVLVPSSNATNLFRFHNFNDFEVARRSFLQNTNFRTVDNAKHNQLSSALSLYSEFLKNIQSFAIDKQNTNNQTKEIPFFQPSQIIYYGVPGCGKSYEVNKVINVELDKYGVTDKEYHKVRCVFHPEYCNADFVGQIYPYVKPDNGGVEYRFKPGPFAEIVRRAYRNPAEPFFLIIEEINRGNAAAIFGEMFQLLDRIRPEDGPEELSGNIYNTGWSSYGVTNIDVNAYVRQKSTDNPEKIEYDDSIPYGDKIKFINNTAVRLPPNLSIYATMNTNDQNVFTMDNAFQRRFKSKMIRNVLDENSAQYKTEIDDTGVCWGDFREWINEKILLPQTAILKADDKCLGGWFITGEKINGVDKIKKEDFAEKVLKYLWDDVFKRNKSGEIFVKDDKVNSLSDLIDAFETSVGFESFEKIFKMNDVDKAKLQKQANT